ncbi:hypothetical protein AURDEDRAFT_161266 [Auricularia subglabra TFB-10046 SS5]|nr:hypothetical protein AURDEDRAFT_161266 [Auricularia subglabra TFB-10046 SS5]
MAASFSLGESLARDSGTFGQAVRPTVFLSKASATIAGHARPLAHHTIRRRFQHPKRRCLEDEYHSEEAAWLEDVQRQAIAVLQVAGEHQITEERLQRDIDALRRDLAEARWEATVRRGAETDTGLERRREFIEAEIEKLRCVPQDLASPRGAILETTCKEPFDGTVLFTRTSQGERVRTTQHAPPPRPQTPPASSDRVTSPHRRPQTLPLLPRRLEQPALKQRDGASQRGSGRAPVPSKPATARKIIVQPVPATDMSELQIEGTVVDARDRPKGAVLQDGTESAEEALAAAAADAAATAEPEFIALSLDEVLAKVPEARRDAAMHEAVWTLTSGFHTPMPLGRYGHPFRKGWLWGEIDPRRVFKACQSAEKGVQESAEYRRLAQEAVTLPFALRSMTQRIVVGWAHHEGVLPMEGWREEPDILFECRSNPDKVSFAVRRRNTVNRSKRLLYTEWDVVDLDCNLLLRLAKPENAPRKDRRNAPRWVTTVSEALGYGAQHRGDFVDVEEYGNGPQVYTGDSSPASVFLHLRRCGFALSRMTSESGRVEDSELGAYLARIDRLDAQRSTLVAKLRGSGPKLGKKAEWPYLSAHMTLEPIPPDRPIARTSTSLLRDHRYYFGKDGVLRFTEKY